MCAGSAGKLDAVFTIITDEQLEAFADAVITKYQQNIARRGVSGPVNGRWQASLPEGRCDENSLRREEVAMGQIDSFKKVLGLDIEEVDPYKRILEESKSIEAAEGTGDFGACLFLCLGR